MQCMSMSRQALKRRTRRRKEEERLPDIAHGPWQQEQDSASGGEYVTEARADRAASAGESRAGDSNPRTRGGYGRRTSWIANPAAGPRRRREAAREDPSRVCREANSAASRMRAAGRVRGCDRRTWVEGRPVLNSIPAESVDGADAHTWAYHRGVSWGPREKAGREERALMLRFCDPVKPSLVLANMGCVFCFARSSEEAGGATPDAKTAVDHSRHLLSFLRIILLTLTLIPDRKRRCGWTLLWF